MTMMDDDDLIQPVGAVSPLREVRPVADRGGNLLYRLRHIALEQAQIRQMLRNRRRVRRVPAPDNAPNEEPPARQTATTGVLGRIIDDEA